MKAWQYVGEGQPLTLNDVAEPTVGPGMVGVDILAAGLCHSDIGLLDGTLPPEMLGSVPRTLGHEIAGRVSELGEGVENVAVGDLVAVMMTAKGPGFIMDGGYAERGAFPAEMLVRVPSGVTAAQAAAATDAGRTAMHNVRDVAGVTQGTRLGIVGLGGLGLIGLQVGIALGAEVYAAEPKESARAAAAELGAAACVADVSELAPFELDVIVDFAGFGTTTAGALKAVRTDGRVVLVGVGRNEATIDTTDFVRRRTKLLSSGASDIGQLVDTLDFIARGQVSPVVSTIDFDDIGDGIERVQRGEVTGRLVAIRGE